MPRTRIFKLPSTLSKQQDAALSLPLEGQHLIIGGPGTGKSVVALLRARRLAQEDKPYDFLVYNHVLRQSNQYLFGANHAFRSTTWLSWFFRLYREVFDKGVPKLQEHHGDFKPIDWSSVDASIHALGEGAGPENLPCIVIDEGQDMPPAFYKALIDLGFANFYVVADQNQQIHPDHCSSIQDIEITLSLDAPTVTLLDNYRNALPVAKLALAFYPGDPASPLPKLPSESRSALTPQLVTYGQLDGPTFDSILVRILKLSDVNPSKLIGIITPDNLVRERFCKGLNRVAPRLDHGKPPIQTYASGNDEQLDFGHGGVVVLNAQSCKGLEFDTVILADIDRHQPKTDIRTLKATFYVMVARARERVILLRTGQTCPVVESLLPADLDILSRS